LLVFIYLVILLPRLSRGVGLVLSLFVVFALITMQFGSLIIYNTWLSLTQPAVFLVAGYGLMLLKVNSEKNRLELINSADMAFLELGKYQFKQNAFDRAFETLRKCHPSKEVFEWLYKTGDAYERRRQYEKAYNLFNYILSFDKYFRDTAKRAELLAEAPDSQHSENGAVIGPSTNLIKPGSGLKRPVLGRYEIERELGRGAMGIVYLGIDPKISRQVAIKTLDFSQSFDVDIDEIKSRFFKEAKSAGRLNHQNIITIYDVGEEDDLAYFAMDYVPGKTLSVFAKPDNLLPVVTVYKMIIQVAEALDYAHRQGIIHRDIKPGNIIYHDNDRLVKVSDFGLARITDTTMTRSGTMLGSPAYMSPEQIKGSKVDGQADIFSLGVTFYQLLTGILPFKGGDLASLTYQVMNEAHPPIQTIREDLPKSASSIINKALMKNPEDRYASAKNMATSLRKGVKQIEKQ